MRGALFAWGIYTWENDAQTSSFDESLGGLAAGLVVIGNCLAQAMPGPAQVRPGTTPK